MGAGESGLGKSTLINTLFETKLYEPKQIPAPGVDRGKTVQIESISAGQWSELIFVPTGAHTSRRYRGEWRQAEVDGRGHSWIR